MKVAIINGSPKPKKSMSRNILETVLTKLEPNAETVWIDTAVGKLPENVCPTLTSCDAAVLAFPLYVDGIPSHLLRVMKDVEVAARTADRDESSARNTGKDEGAAHTMDKDEGAAHTMDKDEGAAHTMDKDEGAAHTMDKDEGAARTMDKDEGAAQNLREKPLMVYPIVNCGFMDEDYPEIAIEMVRLWCNRTGFAFGRAIGFSGGGMGPSLTIGKGPGTALGKALTRLTEDIISGDTGETILTKPAFPRFLYHMSGNQGWKKAAHNRGLKKKDLYRQP